MIVFKTILKILNKIKGMLILYTIMLLSITLINQTGSNQTNFEETKPSIAIINNDKGNYLTDNFINYLNEHTKIKNVKEEKLDDALFYRDISYIIYIPANFHEDMLKEITPSLEYKSNNDSSSSYTEMLVNKYFKTLLIYKDYYKGKELVDKVNETLDSDINIKLTTNLDTSKINSMNTYFNFLNYAFLAGCVYCISMILSSIKEENVYKRTIISSFNQKRYNKIVLLSTAIVIFLMWLFYMILSTILFKDLMFSTNGLLYIFNSLIFSFCALTIGNLIGNFTTKKEAIGGIVNVLAVGSSFLCGCFVPMQYMPSYVLKIARILPTYYYVINNETIKVIENINLETIKPLITNSLIVIIFSTIFILLTNYISKKKQVIN
ncbi:MAG: ABC transporter permease [bacterium]|nr:ABC transporter permease [bacterium]